MRQAATERGDRFKEECISGSRARNELRALLEREEEEHKRAKDRVSELERENDEELRHAKDRVSQLERENEELRRNDDRTGAGSVGGAKAKSQPAHPWVK